MRFPELAAIYLVASALSFLAYGIDKATAQTGAWRIPESFLHLLGLAGGWPGALLARHLFRHKTRKTSFRIGFWLAAALNVVLFGLLQSIKP